MSNESAKLQSFERIAIKNFIASTCTNYAEKPCREYFEEIDFDGVLVGNSGDLVLLEVALGGTGTSLKAGPRRKILTDAFKLASAEHFLKLPSVISKRVLIVKDVSIVSKILGGWSGKALSANQIEVVAASFSPSQLREIQLIISKCVEEIVKAL